MNIFMDVKIGDTCFIEIDGVTRKIRRVNMNIVDGVTYNARVIDSRHKRLFVTGYENVTQ